MNDRHVETANPWEKYILVRFWGGKVNTWRSLITDEMEKWGESWGDVIACTLSEDELNEEFDDGLGCTEGKPFTLWTKRRVYFPRAYDGAEYCTSAPRDPCNEATEHVGGCF